MATMQAVDTVQAQTASPVNLWLEAFTPVLQQLKTAPVGLTYSLPFSSPYGPCSLCFRRDEPVH